MHRIIKHLSPILQHQITFSMTGEEKLDESSFTRFLVGSRLRVSNVLEHFYKILCQGLWGASNGGEKTQNRTIVN